jgi:L,D-transpeptidase YbiS
LIYNLLFSNQTDKQLALTQTINLFTIFSNKFHSSKRLRTWSYILGIIGFIGVLIAFIALFVLVIAPATYEFGARFIPVNVKANSSLAEMDSLALDFLDDKTTIVANLEKQLDKLTPKANYLVINTTDNRFFLYNGKQLTREGICSTGSYTLLVKDDKKKWEFKTPKGIFKIREKKTSPVWKKPDWAFVEDGLPIPSPNHPSRFEYGSLGDYALTLGDGYMIHGTLYQRFLGMPVTHGCIRIGDEDLEAIYRAMPSGAKVYIY